MKKVFITAGLATLLLCFLNIDSLAGCEGDFNHDGKVNLFNIGNSIGEGEAAGGTMGNPNHDTVWSTGYEPGDIVFS